MANGPKRTRLIKQFENQKFIRIYQKFGYLFNWKVTHKTKQEKKHLRPKLFIRITAKATRATAAGAAGAAAMSSPWPPMPRINMYTKSTNAPCWQGALWKMTNVNFDGEWRYVLQTTTANSKSWIANKPTDGGSLVLRYAEVLFK